MKYLGKHSIAWYLRLALNIAWYAGIALTILAVLFTGLLIGFGPPPGLRSPQFTLETELLQVVFPAAAVQEPKVMIIAFMAFGLIMLCLGLGILQQVRRIFATLAAGSPFGLENARRISRIGLLIFAGAGVQFLSGLVLGWLVMENVTVPGVVFHGKGNLNIGGIFMGLVLLVLAEIFRQGALLQAEQDLTI
ncbi:DUF2975 family protein [Hydrogenispora ethanolica]|jgi:hypothetical protein|uniref:DUF2975 family protein n=1 Tax=Hydrogenispora ethanolica TaxID=1082276 RepID=A0A4R1SB77_HYDET|nr:DUF2975 domain-containing protein [Hydrogenispora ethanolica]TCL76250.1 DUF2975 family protein [Hydrogenispora ethanolica]